MVGKAGVLILAAGSLLSAYGQAPSTPAPEASPAPQPTKRPFGPQNWQRKSSSDGQSPEFNDVRRAIDQLSPEQRQRFMENFKRWASLPPEERKVLADREMMRRKKMDESIQGALKEAGLQLEGERRAHFVRRYSEERRKLEEQLRKEIDDKRAAMLKEILARLKAEFSTSPAPAQPEHP